MTPRQGNIVVKFHYDHSQTLVKTDTGLFVPERYMIEGGDEDADAAYGVTTDRKLINPPIVDILSGVHQGKRAFVFYGAFEIAKWLSDDRVADGRAIIPDKMLLFFIDPISCLPKTYLGDEVFEEGPRTESGIWLTPTIETKQGVLIKITHIPANNIVDIGNTVVTVDQYQYDLTYQGRKYIKLDESEIIGVQTQAGYLPIGNKVLVGYLPDVDLEERVAENDKRRAQRDYIDKHHIHISEAYTRGLDPDYLDVPEPKLTNARVIAVGGDVREELNPGDKLLIYRNYGCILPNKQWIIGIDTIVGVVQEG